jgi:hypothetical protein
VLGVLNAGSTISAVEYDADADRYLVRAELYEFLSIVAKRSFEADKANVDLAELEKIVGVALLPDINHNAETVLHYRHPIDEDRGFTAEINLGEVEPDHKRVVRSTLNAGATLGRVQRRSKGSNEFWVHRDLYKTLARIRARTLLAEYGRPRLGHASAQRASFGGSLTERARAIEHKPAIEEESTTEIRGGFVTQLLAALNISAMSWERVSSGAHAAAIAANEVLGRARRANQQLDAVLAGRDDEARLSFDEAYRLLNSRVKPQASWERQMLDDAYQELDQHWPVLMLLPNGPYESVLRDLIEKLEPDAGDGRLSNEQQALYHISRALLEAFQSSARTDEASWRRLGAGFNAAQPETRVAADNGRPTLN